MPASPEAKSRRRVRAAERAREWRKAHPDRARATQARWRKANPEKQKAMGLRYREANRGKLKDRWLSRTYGMTASDVEALLAEQGGRCAACGTSEVKSRKGWHIDHCHSSGKVRGILCHNCNSSLGHAKDSIHVLRSLISYLERNGHEQK